MGFKGDIFSDFEDYILTSYNELIAAISIAAPESKDTSKVVVELPREESHGDLACNAAMVLSRQAGMKPRDLAELFAEALRKRDDVAAVEIAGPGFINIRLIQGRWAQDVQAILNAGRDYGRNNTGSGASINIENPDPAIGDIPVPRERLDDKTINLALSNSFGFGGTNATLALARI